MSSSKGTKQVQGTKPVQAAASVKVAVQVTGQLDAWMSEQQAALGCTRSELVRAALRLAAMADETMLRAALADDRTLMEQWTREASRRGGQHAAARRNTRLKNGQTGPRVTHG